MRGVPKRSMFHHFLRLMGRRRSRRWRIWLSVARRAWGLAWYGGCTRGVCLGYRRAWTIGARQFVQAVLENEVCGGCQNSEEHYGRGTKYDGLNPHADL